MTVLIYKDILFLRLQCCKNRCINIDGQEIYFSTEIILLHSSIQHYLMDSFWMTFIMSLFWAVTF